MQAGQERLELGVLFGQVGVRGAELATRGKTLQQAARHQRHRRECADGRVGGDKRHQRGADQHQRGGQGQGGLAPLLVGVDAQQDGAHRADQVGTREGQEAEQQGGLRVVGREEQPRDRQREQRIDQQVVPLEEGADVGGHDIAQLAFARRNARRARADRC
ncbi:hypothetical protein FQZ97_1054120 [compost metagenome]